MGHTPDPAARRRSSRGAPTSCPALRDAQVLEHVAGLRPGRPTVRLEGRADLADGTPLIHNYGHGGSGITLSWGCAEEVAALAETLG